MQTKEAKKLDPRTAGIRVLNVMREYEKLMLDDLNGLTSTWNHAVDFKVRRNYKDANPRVRVWTDDHIFLILNTGTLVRYATMTRNFIPKTTPGSLTSGQGQGGVSYVDRNVPRPGIEAREFDKTLREKHEKNFKKDIKAAVREGLRVARTRR